MPYIWAWVNWTQLHTPLGHQMLLLGAHLTKGQPDPKVDQMFSWPDIVLLLATRFLYWWGVHLSSSHLDPTESHSWPWDASMGCPPDLNAKRTSENLNTDGVSGLASQRSFLRKTKQYFWNHHIFSQSHCENRKIQIIRSKKRPKSITKQDRYFLNRSKEDSWSVVFLCFFFILLRILKLLKETS